MLNTRPTTHSLAQETSHNPNFREAKRIQQSVLANLEKRTLIWLAARTPVWINSDHLTLLGLLSMAGAGAAYWWSATNRLGLVLVVVCLALNWLGDSLDGTLARFRDHSRPRYGFYVDHVVDAFSAFFLLGGLALSGYMAPLVALGLLIAYLMLSVEIYLATYVLGDFKISYYKMGPTELRILLSIGNLAVLWKSTVHVLGRAHRLFDVAGTLGISGMLLIMVISAVRNTMRLYRQEPIPAGKPVPTQKQLPLGLEKTSAALRHGSKTAILFVAILAGAATAQAQQTSNCLKLKKVKIADHVLHQDGQTFATLTLKVKDCEILEDHQQSTLTFASKAGLIVTVDDITFHRSEAATGGKPSNQVDELEVLLTLRASRELFIGENTLQGMFSYQVANGGAVISANTAISVPLEVEPPRAAYSEESRVRQAWVAVAEIVGGIVLLPIWLIYCPISGQCG